MTQPMRVKGVRFAARQEVLIARMASHHGISDSQYIRDAAWGRAICDAIRLEDPEVLAWLALVEEGTELLDRVRAAGDGDGLH